MKNLFRGIVLCLFLAPTAAFGQDWAAKMFSATSHDFRAVARGAKIEHHFEFENIYQEDVHVAAVRSSCGCTTPSVTKSTVKSREKSAIVAKFNTSSFTGPKSATITVVFDRPFYAEVQLSVTGVIRTDVVFDPPAANFGEIREGETKEIKLSVTRFNRSDWQITDVRSHCTDMQVKLSEPVRSSRSVKYDLVLQAKASMPVGEIHEQLTLLTNDQQSPTVEMCIAGKVRPSLSVSPAALTMGAVKPGGEFTRRLVVRGEQPFGIAKVLCSDERFSFAAPEGQKKVHFLPLTFTADDQAGPIAQSIRIVSDLPHDRYTEFLVTGNVLEAEAEAEAE
ncbi:DUF1573 domain-containing protein [Roseimaritima ulvae]|uniref:DUF1573 domain-containing protein n=1 Tax=Roseimaritima ulvae TaxID=980254 RepID=A0A5B9QWT7_9BACT|nr:DUF1573 domain-containing protein [Roseimaritima ulvae]QEG41576.1 hypothetical protein UC8_36010 [Roseimaritima ulvae]